MQNTIFHNLSSRLDDTRGWIKEKSCDRPPVESPISQNALLVELFQKTIQFLPSLPLNIFPLAVEDSRITSRLRQILGFNHSDPYYVLEKPVHLWIEHFEKLIGKQFIDAEYIVGSATTYIAGKPLLREALDIFLRNFLHDRPNKLELFAKISRAISQKTFSFADVDLRIKVKPGYSLERLQSLITEFRTELFNGKVLIVYLGEKKKNALDLVIYTELDAERATNLDDFTVDICKSDIENNRVVFRSTDPWKWWIGHTIGILEDYTTDGYRSLPRFLWQLSKSKICVLQTESLLFQKWMQKISHKLQTDPTAFKKQFDKHQANHDRHFPFANPLMRLRTQQLLRNHSLTSLRLFREAANTEVDQSTPSFIKAVFDVMKEKGSDITAVHGLIECIAMLALYEAWQKPFEVKLVQHEGVWVQRIRFRGNFGKRDLLVRFDIPAAHTFLSQTTSDQWQKMRIIIHSLWFDGLSQREVGKNYKKMLGDKKVFFSPLEAKTIALIKKRLLSMSDALVLERPFAQNPPLAVMEISSHQEGEILLEVGKLVFNYYHHDMNLRNQLCWKVVHKCIDQCFFSQAAELVKMLREAHNEPTEGYISLFANSVLKGGNSYLLYQACSPFTLIDEEKWIQLAESKSKAKFVVLLMNEANVSAELFLEMTQLLKIKNPEVGENLLYKILIHDQKRTSLWIADKDRPYFVSQEYNQFVSQYILNNRSSFNPDWIKNYLLSKRFIGSDTDRHSLCKYLLSKPLEVQEKAKLLHIFEIKDESLWQIVANEYVSQGEHWPVSLNNDAHLDCESLVMWYQIIENADNKSFVEETLKKIKPPPANSKDSMRGLVLVRLLKNWEKRKVHADILKMLDPSKKTIDWETIVHHANTAEDILRALNNVSLPLYSALFRAIKPKEAFYALFWEKMVQNAFPERKTRELLAALETPLMTDCLQINQQVSLPLFKRLIVFKEGIDFILVNLKEADLEIMHGMMEACTQFDDDGATGAKVFMKFYDPTTHKKHKFTNHLAILAKKILSIPQGDTEAAGRMWNFSRKLANPDKLPCKDHLVRLIQYGYSEWVIDMLNNAKHDELETLGPDFYCRLLRTVKDLDKRCVILEGCPLISQAIQRLWEIIAYDDFIDDFNAVKLLRSAKRLEVPDTNVQRFAIAHIRCNVPMGESVQNYLLEMTSRIDSISAYQLWEALRNTKQIDNTSLWSAGFHILCRNPNTPHYFLLNWLVQHCSVIHSEQLVAFINKITATSLDERLLAVIFPFIKREALKNSDVAKEIYWKLDCDDNITATDFEILKPNEDQCYTVLERLLEKQSKSEEIMSIFGSTFYLWENLRKCSEADNQAQLNLDSHFFNFIDIVISSTNETEILRWIPNIAKSITIALKNLACSTPMQNVCQFVIKNSKSVSIDDKVIILEYLIDHNLFLDNLWKLINSISDSDNELHFKCAVRTIEKLKTVDKCSAKLFFRCYQFPDCIPQLKFVIEKNIARRNYLRAIYLGAMFIQSPTKETALNFLKLLPSTFKYLEAHKKAELNDWINATFIRKTNSDIPEVEGEHADIVFIKFVVNVIYTHKEIFYDKEVTHQFLESLNLLPNNGLLRISLLVFIAKNAPQKANKESAALIVKFILTQPIKEDQASTKNVGKEAPILNHLMCLAAELIVKFAPEFDKWIDPCCQGVLAFNNYLPNNQKQMQVTAYSAYMVLKGDIHGFDCCSPELAALAITDAIKLLCQHPKEKNLEKATELFMNGINEVLFLFPSHFKNANQYFIHALFILIDEIAQREKKEFPIQAIPQFFTHLIDNEIFRFKTTCEEINTHLKRLYTKAKTEPKLLVNNKILEEIQRTRLSLFNYNFSFLAKKIPHLMHSIISALNVTMLPPVTKIFMDHKDLLQDLMNYIMTESPRNNPRCHQEIAALLCHNPYIPKDCWGPYFSDVQMDSLFHEIQSSQSYFERLEDSKWDEKALIELLPEMYYPELFTKDEKALIAIFQWCQVSSTVFPKNQIGDNTLLWMLLFQAEFIKAMEISSHTSSLIFLTIYFQLTLPPVIELNARVAKTDPSFANNWLQSLIKALESKLNIDSSRWFLNLIDENIQASMTLELLPSLPYIEEFNHHSSVEQITKSCVEAYYCLISQGCHDDNILDKALNNLSTLGQHVRLCSGNKVIDESAINSPAAVDVDEYRLKLNRIYFAGFLRVIYRFKQHQNIDKFIDQFTIFREQTKESYQDLNQSDIFLKKLYKTFNDNLHLFSDVRCCTEMMEFFTSIQSFTTVRASQLLKDLANENISYLMLAVFFGQDDGDAHRINKYLAYYSKKAEAILETIDIKNVDDEDFLTLAIYNAIIFKMINIFPELTDSIINRANPGPKFRKLFLNITHDIIVTMDHYAKIRPASKDWYDRVKAHVIGLLD